MVKEAVYTVVISTSVGQYACGDSHNGPNITSGQGLAILLDGIWVEGTVRHSRVTAKSLMSAWGLYTSEQMQSTLPVVGGYYVVSHGGNVCGLCAGMRVQLL